MAITRPLLPVILGGAAVLLAACGSTSGSVTEAGTGTSSSAAATSAAASAATSSAAATEETPTEAPSTQATPTSASATEPTATEATGTATETATDAAETSAAATATAAFGGVDPCTLLDPDAIQQVIGAAVDDGTDKQDDARLTWTCTWQGEDPFAIVVTALTSVAADEAYTTNKELAPAYFDGEAVETPVAGADRAYVVKSGDTGYAVGVLAKGRFLSVQVGLDGVTDAQAVALAERAIAALP